MEPAKGTVLVLPLFFKDRERGLSNFFRISYNTKVIFLGLRMGHIYRIDDGES